MQTIQNAPPEPPARNTNVPTFHLELSMKTITHSSTLSCRMSGIACAALTAALSLLALAALYAPLVRSHGPAAAAADPLAQTANRDCFHLYPFDCVM